MNMRHENRHVSRFSFVTHTNHDTVAFVVNQHYYYIYDDYLKEESTNMKEALSKLWPLAA